MLKILQAGLQQYMNCEVSDVQPGFRKADDQRSNCQHLLDHQKSTGQTPSERPSDLRLSEEEEAENVGGASCHPFAFTFARANVNP